MAIELALEEDLDHTIILDIYGFEKKLPVTKKRFEKACMDGAIIYSVPYALSVFIEGENLLEDGIPTYGRVTFERSPYMEDRKTQRFLVRKKY